MNIFRKMGLAYSLYQLYKLWESLPMKEFFSSKKAMALIVGIITTILINVVGITPEQADVVTKAIEILASAYMVGQGIADHGKEAAKITAAANGGSK